MLEHLRPWLEATYFLSGFILAIVALYGIQQVRLLKRDIQTKNERAAKEKAIEYAGRYLTVFVPLYNKFSHERNEKRLPNYSGPIGNFTEGSISPEWREKAVARALKCLSWLPAANELEHVSAAFTSGVANEELGFQVFGRSFCASASSLYDVLSLCRKEEASTYFSSIVNLFNVWRSRLAKGDLEIHRKELDSQLSNMSETRIPIIGE